MFLYIIHTQHAKMRQNASKHTYLLCIETANMALKIAQNAYELIINLITQKMAIFARKTTNKLLKVLSFFVFSSTHATI